MAPKSIGACGQFFTVQSPKAANQDTINWYPEVIDDPAEGQRIVLNPAPGVTSLASIGTGPYRGHVKGSDGLVYVVSGSEVYSVTSALVKTLLGTISNTNSNAPVSMASSSTQLGIFADGLGYFVTLATGVLTQITDGDFPTSVLWGGYSDGYFITVTATKINVSALNDIINWDALDFTVLQASTNVLVGGLIYNQRLVVFGSEIAQPFSNTGNTDFPYESDGPAATITRGLAATFAATKHSSGFVYLASDERGLGIIVDQSGNKISSLAVDYAIQSATTTSDCVACSFQYQGHEFAQFSFPAAKMTLRYDFTNGMWHKAQYWNTAAGAGRWEAHLGLFHTFAFGKHLMGSRVGAELYQLSGTVYTDNLMTLRRIRRFPHIRSGGKRIFYDWLEVLGDMGIGLQVADQSLTEAQRQLVAGYDPKLTLRFSDDGGKTWSSDMQVSMGKIGQYDVRAIFNNLGSAYDRVFELEATDPVPYRLTEALSEFEVGV